jgi:chlorobactene glucosyltransferase
MFFYMIFFLLLGIIGGSLLLQIINLCTFARLRISPAKLAVKPLVSILVPARNEEDVIERCVRSLVQQDYEPLEILVLDDQSQDKTATIVQSIIDELPAGQKQRLRLLQGEALPSGWVGKNHACYQLAQQATGEYLIFTDADTIHAPGVVQATISYMHHFKLQLLTALPEHIMSSIGERLILPLLQFTIFTYLPIVLVYKRPETSLSIGNGQFLCFAHSAYEATGGHAAVKNRILEDMHLARNIKKAGYRMMLVDGQGMLQCHMYRSFHDVWDGFSKNLFALYNNSLLFAFCALLFNMVLFVLPAFILLASFVIALPSPLFFAAAIIYLLTVLLRVIVTLRLVQKQRFLMLLLCFLNPLSHLLEDLILLNSIHWHYRKTGTRWKGRYYSAV